MHDYRMIKPLSLRNSTELVAVLDLGLSVTIETSFKLARVKAPALDLSAEVDPEIAMRNFIVQWLKTSPAPFTVQLYKTNGEYSGDIIDRDGTTLADDLIGAGLVEGPVARGDISNDDTVYFDAVANGI